MELRDFFLGSWRALVLVPSVTAIVAGTLFVSTASERYEATAVITITEYFPGNSAADVRAVIADLGSALESRQVIEVVFAAIPDADSFQIELITLGDGGDVRVSIEGPTRLATENALDLGVREAMTMVSESEGRKAARRLVAADAVAGDAVVALQNIEAEAGAADLQEELARRSADILSLRNQIGAAEGNDAVQGALEFILLDKRSELDEIEAELLPWTNARARFDLAVASGADSSLELRRIETSQDDLRTEELLRSLRTEELSSLPDLLRVVVAAAVVTAGVVMLAFFLLGSDRRSSPRPRRSKGPRGAVDAKAGSDRSAWPGPGPGPGVSESDSDEHSADDERSDQPAR